MSGVQNVPVTVIIPCYMATNTIDRAVESVMAQTMLPSEIILIDDASPDDGLTSQALDAIRTRYECKTCIKVIKMKKNGGPSVARNAGWDSAKEPYIAFLDADDSWHPKKLEIQYGWMADRPEVTMSGHLYLQLSEDSGFPMMPETWTTQKVKAASLLLSNCFPTPSVMLQRNLPHRFSPHKRRSEDYLLWLQLVLDGCQAWLLKVPLAYTYKSSFGESGLSGNLWEMELGELNTYWELTREQRIGMPLALLLSGYSLMKHCRRWLVTHAWRAE